MGYNPLKNIDVLLLCGGKGMRLRSVLNGIPKPMVKIGDTPLLDIIIGRLADFGFSRFILAVGYKAKIIKDYYGKKVCPGIKIVFSLERSLLDTGGALKNAGRLIKSNTLFVLNGDSLCKFNPRLFLSFHKRRRALASILLKNMPAAKEYGGVKLDSHSRIKQFEEKNKASTCRLASAGVYILDKKIFKFMPSDAKFSLEYDLFPGLLGKRIFGYSSSGSFMDIGTPGRLNKARRAIKINIAA